MKDYKDIWFKSTDGLTLYARDYDQSASCTTVVCIPGLTRNSADFSPVAEHLCNRYRVIAVDLRGRGKSEYDTNPKNYHPRVYVEDLIALVDALGLDTFALIGSSLGGLISMFLATILPERVSAVILNDIGPEVNLAGLDRIRSYVSDPGEVGSWEEAVEKTRSIHGAAFPDFEKKDWQSFAEKLYNADDSGNLTIAYDPTIAVLMNEDHDAVAPPELWPIFEIIPNIPLMLVRGILSDIITEDTVKKMLDSKPEMKIVDVANRGHAPLLSEPECLENIDLLLSAAFANNT